MAAPPLVASHARTYGLIFGCLHDTNSSTFRITSSFIQHPSTQTTSAIMWVFSTKFLWILGQKFGKGVVVTGSAALGKRWTKQTRAKPVEEKQPSGQDNAQSAPARLRSVAREMRAIRLGGPIHHSGCSVSFLAHEHLWCRIHSAAGKGALQGMSSVDVGMRRKRCDGRRSMHLPLSCWAS